MTEPIIERFMTKAPYTIGHQQTIATAHRIMRTHSIRHLPVLDGGRLAGIVSEGDLHLIETLRDVDPEEVEVSEAMRQETFAVGPLRSVQKVAAEMAANKYGCAVVLDAGHVVGVFTTIDALNALSSMLEERRSGGTQDVPTMTRVTVNGP